LPVGVIRPLKVIANAFSAGFDLIAHRALPRPVGSGVERLTVDVVADLSDPDARVIVVGNRDRLARLWVGELQAALSAQGRRFVVADLGERTDDLVRDVIEVLTGECAGRYGRCGARDRAMRALTAAKGEPGGAA
jgi:putative resolvase